MFTYICTINNGKTNNMITLNYNQAPTERVEILKANREEIISMIRSYSDDKYYVKDLMGRMLKAAQDNNRFLNESSDEKVLSINKMVADHFGVILSDCGIAQENSQLDQYFSDERARVMQQYSRKFA